MDAAAHQRGAKDRDAGAAATAGRVWALLHRRFFVLRNLFLNGPQQLQFFSSKRAVVRIFHRKVSYQKKIFMIDFPIKIPDRLRNGIHIFQSAKSPCFYEFPDIFAEWFFFHSCHTQEKFMAIIDNRLFSQPAAEHCSRHHIQVVPKEYIRSLMKQSEKQPDIKFRVKKR